MIGLCLVVMGASSALGSASASALLAEPELGRCVKVAPGSGEYKVASCTGGAKAAGGSYDWKREAIKDKFVSAGGVTVLEAIGGTKYECKTLVNEGEYDNDGAGLLLRLFGCRDVALNFECTNAAPENIVTPTLPGEWGFIMNKLNKEGKLVVSVGLELGIPEPSVKFECGPNKNKFELSGQFIVPIAPIDKMSTTFKLKAKAVAGKQHPAKFEGGGVRALTLQQVFPPMPPKGAGLTSTDTITSEEPLEIKAKE